MPLRLQRRAIKSVFASVSSLPAKSRYAPRRRELSEQLERSDIIAADAVCASIPRARNEAAQRNDPRPRCSLIITSNAAAAGCVTRQKVDDCDDA